MDGCGADGGQSVDWSPDVGPTLMLYLGDATFSQHVVTDFTEHFKLLSASEFVLLGSIARTDDFENVCFEH